MAKKAKVRRRYTRVGKAILLIMVLILLAAWNTGTNLYYIVFGGLTSFYLISRLMATGLLRNVYVTIDAPPAVHRGDPFSVGVRIENRKRILPSMAIRIEQVDSPGTSEGFALIIPPRRAALLNLTHTYTRRGVHPAPRLCLASAFPFGLIDCRLEAPATSDVVVYPRVRAIRTVTLDQQSGTGIVPRTNLAEGDEFHSLRDYVRGDDLRRVAWRQSARLGTLLVRELEQETSRYVLFVFDTKIAGLDEESSEAFEEAVELVASLAVTLLSRQYRVAIQTPSHHLEEEQGKGHIIKVLEFLARVEPIVGEGPSNFGFASAHDIPGCTEVFISASPDQWGVTTRLGGPKVLHPRDVIHA